MFDDRSASCVTRVTITNVGRCTIASCVSRVTVTNVGRCTIALCSRIGLRRVSRELPLLTLGVVSSRCVRGSVCVVCIESYRY